MSVCVCIPLLRVILLHTFSFESLRILSLILTAPQGLWDLSSRPGTLPGFTAMGVWRPNRWTAKQFPRTLCIEYVKWLPPSFSY